MARKRRYATYLGLSICFLLFLTRLFNSTPGRKFAAYIPYIQDPTNKWAHLRRLNPLESYTPLPTDRPLRLPRIQRRSIPEDHDADNVRVERQRAVEDSFKRAWFGYKSVAWQRDAVRVVSGEAIDCTTGGWAELLFESLDTLFIMGQHEDFEIALSGMSTIDFSGSMLDEVGISQVSARHLGGLLSTFDLTGRPEVLEKAVQVGEMIYAAFDTPNHLPVLYWDWHKAESRVQQEQSESAILAETASICLEFTRLSQITGNPKWYDAAMRIVGLLDEQQNHTKLPGMWPAFINLQTGDFTEGDVFGLGAMFDSAYEMLPKMHSLTGGIDPVYQKMYTAAMEPALNHTLFRPMTPENLDILFPGLLHVRDEDVMDLEAQGQHLSCFASSMLGLGSRLFENDEHMEYATKILEGCIWAYDAFVFGIMPELFHLVPCEENKACQWDDAKWQEEVEKRIPSQIDGRPVPKALKKDIEKWIKYDLLPKGFTSIGDRRHFLRSEVAESLFYLYRITGRKELQDVAWAIFSAVEKFTMTIHGNAALEDVTVVDTTPVQINEMLSNWMSETLKYFYLIFSEPHLMSLDEWVFNTAGHAFRRPM